MATTDHAPVCAPALPLAGRADPFAALAAEWDGLAELRLTPIQQTSWSQAAYETLRHRGTLEIARVTSDDGRLLAAAPLLLEHGPWPRRRTMLGVELLQEPMDFLYRDEAALEQLFRQLAGGSPLVLHRLPVEGPSLARLRRVLARRAVIVERPQANYPFIELSHGWSDPESQLSSRRRSDLRRARKRAEEYGAVACEVVAPEPYEVDALLDEAFAIEARSWKGEAGTALGCDPVRSGFYRLYARAAAEQGTLRICWLRFGTTAVAMQIAVEMNRAFWLLKIGYDQQFARSSPGNLLICETLRHAAEAGLASYEFLGMSADWTRVWTETERESVVVRIYPYSLAGMAALAVDTSRFGWQRLRRRLPWSR